MEAITILPQNRHFAARKDEWDKKEGTGKSMKNAFSMHSQAEVVPNKKIKPIALVELH